MSSKEKSNVHIGKGGLMENDDDFHADFHASDDDFDDDAKEFDINVHFIARPCDVAAEKVDQILDYTLAWLKKANERSNN